MNGHCRYLLLHIGCCCKYMQVKVSRTSCAELVAKQRWKIWSLCCDFCPLILTMATWTVLKTSLDWLGLCPTKSWNAWTKHASCVNHWKRKFCNAQCCVVTQRTEGSERKPSEISSLHKLTFAMTIMCDCTCKKEIHWGTILRQNTVDTTVSPNQVKECVSLTWNSFLSTLCHQVKLLLCIQMHDFVTRMLIPRNSPATQDLKGQLCLCWCPTPAFLLSLACACWWICQKLWLAWETFKFNCQMPEANFVFNWHYSNRVSSRGR